MENRRTLNQRPARNAATRSNQSPSKTDSARAASQSSNTDYKTDEIFRFDAPSANEVLLAADFTDWERSPVRMVKGGGGVWHCKVPVKPGQHRYKFLVDGHWQTDPDCDHVSNGFGTLDNIRVVQRDGHE